MNPCACGHTEHRHTPLELTTETWPIPWLRHEPADREMRADIAADRAIGQHPLATCGICHEGPLRCDYHYVRRPYEYRCYAICPNHHIEEF
jgi:hypothetical protein